MAAAVLAAAFWGSSHAAESAVWRGGWCSLGNIEAKIACAKRTGFTALIAHGPVDRMQAFAKLSAEQGVEAYFWFAPTPGDKALDPFQQEMSPEDDRRLAELKADNTPDKQGYQFGGEPQSGRHEVLESPLLCFHHPEVAEHCRQQLRAMLEACPELTGVAFDYFGYRNYRYCQCARSRQLLDEFRQAQPELDEGGARDRFSLESLVAFNNELAAFVRTTRPGAKVATHVYPVFLPDPLYGNRLDVDYCCQTVAWFFVPYWSRERTAQYAAKVVGEQARYRPQARGVPFLGVYAGKPFADKTPERLTAELTAVRTAVGLNALSIYNFDEFVKHPELEAALAKALQPTPLP
jgi:hypothetical protein